MFPAGMFAKSYFTGTYFPPVEGGAPPIPPTPISYGRPRSQPIPRGWPIDLDDEELMFWIL
jgi:hypothetical protein